jgi:hypothetical protein
MTLTMVLIGALIMGGVIYLAALPILTERQLARQAQRRYDAQYAVQDVRARYELLLNSILDLDSDYDMGKVNETVYAEQRKMLIGRSVYMRKQLDELEAADFDTDNDVLEALIDARRQEKNAHREAELEAQIASYRKEAAS